MSKPVDVSQQAGPKQREPSVATDATGDQTSRNDARLEKRGDGDGPAPQKPAWHLLVGVGASAGGLEALSELFENLDSDHMTFVVMQHLSPHVVSLLPKLLQRVTKINVIPAVDGVVVAVNTVHVAPPNADVVISNGRLSVTKRSGQGGNMRPIDSWFISLAEDQGHRAVGIVLSGTGSDGTEGLRAIRTRGGATFAQDLDSAKFVGMPEAAAGSGCVQHCMPPAAIARELTRLSEGVEPSTENSVGRSEGWLEHLLSSIRQTSGIDFTCYRPSTLIRRIEQRSLRRKSANVQQYVRDAQLDPDELAFLAEDMLIGVTRFFRDREYYAFLRETLVPEICERDARSALPLRVWVSACSTGEEAYSIAITLALVLERLKSRRRLQIFATDLSKKSIEFARRGVYPVAIADDVDEALLEKYFIHQEGAYHVKPSLRAMVLFSTHNMLSDVPFSRMNLITCRNVLIYLRSSAQQEILKGLHYALSQDGYLALGTSESASEASGLYQARSIRHKVYGKQRTSNSFARSAVDVAALDRAGCAQAPQEKQQLVSSAVVEQQIIAAVGAAAIVFDLEGYILEVRGETSDIVALRPGQVRLDLSSISPPQLRNRIRQAVADCTAEIQNPAHKAPSTIDPTLHARPFTGPDGATQGVLVVLHLDTKYARAKMASPSPGRILTRYLGTKKQLVEVLQSKDACIEHLQAEIDACIIQRETTASSLAFAREDSQAKMEELQTTVEELETSKEEMQSANEEITVVNEELRSHMDESETHRHNLAGLLASIELPIMLLDKEKNLRHYSDQMQRLFNLRPNDVGAPPTHLYLGFAPFRFDEKIDEAQKTRCAIRQDVIWQKKQRYHLTIKPVEGESERVQTFIALERRAPELATGQKALVEHEASQMAEANWSKSRYGVIGLTADRTIFWANTIVLSLLRVRRADLLGKKIDDTGLNHQLLSSVDGLLRALEDFIDETDVVALPMTDKEGATTSLHLKMSRRFLPSGQSFYTLAARES